MAYSKAKQQQLKHLVSDPCGQEMHQPNVCLY